MNRRLATILAADVSGYSALMESDEARTIEALGETRRIIEKWVQASNGRVFARAGDGFLAEFQSPVSAVWAGFDIQREIAQRRRSKAEALELRIGIHLADVVAEGEDLLGDGVNVAARIESVCRPGAVTVSQSVFDQVKRVGRLNFESLGPTRLKNLSDPLCLFQVISEQESHSYSLGEGSQPPLADTKSAESEGRPSLAVVPIATLSAISDKEYIAEGITEDLITELSRFRGLFVISRNASLSYLGKSVSLSEVGRQLGVEYCLHGSVRHMGARMRLSVQLSRADTEESIWADRFDFGFEDLFAIQDEIVARIVATVAGRVETTLLGKAKQKRPSDLGAYECVLRGLEHHRLGGVTLEDAKRAVDWFDRAIEIDPGYARAHAWRSCSRHTLGEWLKDDWWEESLSSVQRALELDENDAEAHRIMGVMCMHSRQWEKSRYHFERALEINPNHANVVARAGEIYNFMGDPDRALRMVKRAQRLDPFLPDYSRELEIAALYRKGACRSAIAISDQLTRRSRRAAAYRVAASTYLEDKDLTNWAVSDLLRIDPEFRISAFVTTEYYRDPAILEALIHDLGAGGLPN